VVHLSRLQEAQAAVMTAVIVPVKVVDAEAPAHLAAGSMTLKIGWLYETGNRRGTWLHEADDWHQKLAELGMWPQSSYAVVNDLEAFAASGLVGIHTLRQIRRWGESLRICRLNFDAVCGPFNDLGRAHASAPLLAKLVERGLLKPPRRWPPRPRAPHSLEDVRG
jgi:hypothetical protein